MSLYKTRKALGLCVQCKAPAITGQTRCAEHGARASAARRRYRVKYALRDQCYSCGGEVEPGRHRCIGCARYAAERERARRQVELRKSSCSLCYEPGHNKRTCRKLLTPE